MLRKMLGYQIYQTFDFSNRSLVNIINFNLLLALFFSNLLSIDYLLYQSLGMTSKMSDSLVHAAAGAVGGMIATGITYPLINISTRAQVETKKNPNENTKQAVMKVLKKDGISGLYDGLSSSLLGIAVTNGIYYLFFEESRTSLLKFKKKPLGTLTTLESMLAGAIAGSATSIISNPIWVVNTRQTVRTSVTDEGSGEGAGQAVMKKKLSFIETVLFILKTDGAGAFFKGLGPALILVINPIIQYTVFEQLKNFIVARRHLTRKLAAGKSASVAAPALSDLDYFLLGAFSKLIATGLTYPYLTVKSRMQANNAEGRSYTSSLDGLQKILAKEGIEGLYRGIRPKLLQSVLTAAFLFASKERVYQITKKMLMAPTKAVNA